MSKSQKRAWLEMMISSIGLVCCGFSCYFFNKKVEEPPLMSHMHLITLFIILCLTGFVVTAAMFRAKSFDERECILSRKSQLYGFFGIFVFLTSVAMFFYVQNIKATVPIRMLLLFIVSSFFFSVIVTSISFLLMYQSRIDR